MNAAVGLLTIRSTHTITQYVWSSYQSVRPAVCLVRMMLMLTLIRILRTVESFIDFVPLLMLLVLLCLVVTCTLVQ